MKALLLSIVIAFSSSFALAKDSTSCPLADTTFTSSEGALTKRGQKYNTNNGVRVTHNGTSAVK